MMAFNDVGQINRNLFPYTAQLPLHLGKKSFENGPTNQNGRVMLLTKWAPNQEVLTWLNQNNMDENTAWKRTGNQPEIHFRYEHDLALFRLTFESQITHTPNQLNWIMM